MAVVLVARAKAENSERPQSQTRGAGFDDTRNIAAPHGRTEPAVMRA